MKVAERIQFDRARLMRMLRAGLHIGALQSHMVPEGMEIQPLDLKAELRLLSCRFRVLEKYLIATGAVTQEQLEIELNKELDGEVTQLEEELTKELKFTVKLR